MVFIFEMIQAFPDNIDEFGMSHLPTLCVTVVFCFSATYALTHWNGLPNMSVSLTA